MNKWKKFLVFTAIMTILKSAIGQSSSMMLKLVIYFVRPDLANDMHMVVTERVKSASNFAEAFPFRADPERRSLALPVESMRIPENPTTYDK